MNSSELTAEVYRASTFFVRMLLLACIATALNAANAQQAFNGDTHSPAVTRETPPMTVVGKSQTTIAALTANSATIDVFGFGFTTPSGQLSFTDVSSGTPVTPPVTLDAANATAALLPQVTTPTGANTLPDWTCLGDLNGDGKLDLVTSLYATDSVSVQLGNGDGTFQSASTIKIITGFGPAECHLVSLRGNGTLDLIVGSFNYDQTAVLLGNGDGTFGGPKLYVAPPQSGAATSLTSGDFNDDGNLDLAIVNTSSGTGYVSIFLGDGTGELHSAGAAIAVGNDAEAIRAGDFNGNGYSDLVIVNFSDGTMTSLNNKKDGTFTKRTKPVGSGIHSGPQAIAMTGSGATLQLVVANFYDNTVSIFKSEENGQFGGATTVNVGKGPDDLNFADFNGDGIPDLVVANYLDETVDLLLGSSAGFTLAGTFKVGNRPYSATVGDLNLDGTPDVVVPNTFSNNTQVLLGGMQISVPYTGLSLTPGSTLRATYTPDGASKYGSSTSASVTAP